MAGIEQPLKAGSSAPSSTAATDADVDTHAHAARSIFISYASQDLVAANKVCAALEAAGWPCWIAPRDVRPGEPYAAAIVEAINACRLLILILTKNAVDSRHVLREIERASSKNRTVLSVRLESCELPPELEYFLSANQWLDASGGTLESVLPPLIESVRGSARTEARPAATAAAGPPASRQLNRPLIALVAVVVAVLGYFAFDKLWLPRHLTAGTTGNAAPATPGSATAGSATPGSATPAFNPPPHSIAVLPFVNMSGDPKQDYFSDGMSEELLNSLASVRELQVAARTSSFSYKGSGTNVADIARQLNVGAVLEGSVRKDGARVRITAQLINAVTGFHLWSQTYDRELKNVLALQTDIANAVTKALQATLLNDVSAAVELGGTHDPRAFDAYLRGKGIEETSKETSLAEIAAYDEAIRLDPAYAKAYIGKANALGHYAGSYEPAATARSVIEQAHSIALKAVQLAPDLAEAHLALASSYDDGLLDFAHGKAEYERAQALAPGDAHVLRAMAAFLARLGHADQAIAIAQHAVTLDPVNALSYDQLGYVLLFGHHNREAIAAFDHALSLDPNIHWAHGMRGLAYLGLGEFEAAQQSCTTPPLSWVGQLCLAIAYDKLGRKAEAQALVAKMQAESGDAMAYQYASIYAQWGDVSSALDWLDTAFRLKDPGFAWLKVDSLLDPLRKEPRFQAIEARLNFPP
jgi:TolB-like protein/Flp pilus assembly protein TadD